MPLLSVVIPVYNEADGVKCVLDPLYKALKASGMDFEIVLVDDGSADGTRESIAQSEFPAEVRKIFHKKNRGYGAALKTGIKAAAGEYVFITDCDSTYPVERVPEFARKLMEDKCDMIVGARTEKDAAIPFVRRPAKFILKVLANYLTGEHIPDLNSGFRGMKKQLVLKYMRLLPDGFSFTTTITLAFLTNDLRVDYEPIKYMKRKGRSKIRPIADTLGFARLIMSTVLYFNPLKIFIPFSIILVFAGVCVLVYSHMFLPKILDDTVVTIFLTALQVFALGLIADLIDKRMKD